MPLTLTPQTMPATTAVLDRLKGQLAQIDALIAEGVLTGEAARRARDDLERQLLAAVMQPAAGASATAAKLAASTPEPRPPRSLVLAVTAFVLVVGVGGYAALGNHAGLRVEPGMPGTEAAGHAPDTEQVEAMIAKLVERLKTQPDDAEGWATLGRSYSAQGRHPEALPAFKRVAELRPKDAQALADYADALAVANGRSLEGEPEKLILQAVQLDPKNIKALALAGTVAFNRGQFKEAIALWERAVQDADPQADFVQSLQGAIDEARRRGGAPATPATQAAPAAATTAAATPAAASPAQSVSGRVTLKPSLRAQVTPDDTVFIFARAPSGSRMPLAIMRRKVSDLPLDFSLDDSQAMSPATALSTVSQVVVGVRITKTGSAVPAPGDLQALSAPVALGTRNIQLEIADAVK